MPPHLPLLSDTALTVHLQGAYQAQYDYDAQTVMGFLHAYGLYDDFKCNIEPNHTTLAGHDYEHDIIVSSKFGMLGSIDCNTGDTLVGWYALSLLLLRVSFGSPPHLDVLIDEHHAYLDICAGTLTSSSWTSARPLWS